MKKFLVFLCALLLVFGMALTAHANIITLQPGPEGKDTWIWDSENYSHGDWGELRANNTSTHNQFILIEFDLASLTDVATVNSAILGLYRYDEHSGNPLTLDSHKITSPWQENVTWSTQPSYSSYVEDSVTVSGTTNGWYTWDLTSLTQAWFDSTVNNYGVAIYNHGTGYYQRFVSSDNVGATQPSWALPPTDPSLRPYLEIDYTPYGSVPEPATMLLLGSGLFGLAVFGRKKFFKR